MQNFGILYVMPNQSYTPLEGESLKSLGVIPTFNTGENVSFVSTTTFLYTLFFVAIVVASFYRYVIAGALRMQASENTIRQSNEIIKRVTLGLLGVFSLFIILFTVNKNMLTGDIDLKALSNRPSKNNTTPSSTPSNQPTTSAINNPPIPTNNDDPVGWEAIRNDSTIRSQLLKLPNGGISVNKTVCNNPTLTQCTTVGGLPQATLSMLQDLRSTCSGNIMITGGSETGHKSHGPGKTSVDLSLSSPGGLEACIRSFPKGANLNYCYPGKVYEKFGFIFCDEIGVRHWHVFKK